MLTLWRAQLFMISLQNCGGTSSMNSSSSPSSTTSAPGGGSSSALSLERESIYFEMLWVLLLFGATALLRESVGELTMQAIAKGLLRCTHVSGRTIDVVASCSNGGRSLGFGALWRLWNVEPSVVHRWLIAMPFLCWAFGMPVKLVAVQAVRGGNALLGESVTWALGIGWIVFCVAMKLVAIATDRLYGVLLDDSKQLVSYRRVFQNRFCTVEALGAMLDERPYRVQRPGDAPLDAACAVLITRPANAQLGPLGVDIVWHVSDSLQRRMKGLSITLSRHGLTDKSHNGLRL